MLRLSACGQPALHRALVHSELSGDPGRRCSHPMQSGDFLPAFAPRRLPLRPQLDQPGWRWRRGIAPSPQFGRHDLCSRLYCVAVTTNRVPQSFTQTVEQVPAVSHLHCARGAPARTIRIEPGAIASDNLDPRPPFKPARDTVGITIRKQIEHAIALQIADDGSVALATPPGPYVDGSLLQEVERIFLIRSFASICPASFGAVTADCWPRWFPQREALTIVRPFVARGLAELSHVLDRLIAPSARFLQDPASDQHDSINILLIVADPIPYAITGSSKLGRAKFR